MSKYIDATMLQKNIEFNINQSNLTEDYYKGAMWVLDQIRRCRRAKDVKKVVRGEWLDNGISDSVLAKCSVCGIVWGAVTFDFCPSCGADMRGELND